MTKDKKLERANIEDIIALSPVQQGMLFHYLNGVDNEHYLEQLCLTLSGDIDTEVIVKAWNHLVKTNEMLRTIYKWDKIDSPVQIIFKNYETPIEIHDVSNCDDTRKKDMTKEIIAKDYRNGVDIEEKPIRINIIKLDDKRYELIITYHHILYDGWSSGILIKELINACNTLAEGKEPIKIEKNKFKEFIKWGQKQDKTNQEKYWRKCFEGYSTTTQLAIKTNSEKEKGHNHLQHKLSEETTKSISHFCKSHNLTMATLLYTSWGILIQKYNNTNDIVFGTTVSGRNAKISDIENMVGLFINTLPLRITTNVDYTIENLLKEVDRTLKERDEYQHTPLVDIIKYSNTDTKESLFDTLVVIENYPIDKMLSEENNSVKIENYSMKELTNYKLTLAIMDFDGLKLEFSYDLSLFDDSTIKRMAEHFENILKAITANIKTNIKDIQIITEEEKNQLLIDFNDTKADYPKDKTVHQLFEEQVERLPDNIAAVYEDKSFCSSSLTYKKLNEKANQLARLLRSKGIARESIVGIMVDRSLEMLIGIMAILKAGGAYLPIDPNYPEDRIRFMLEDSNSRVVLSQTWLRDRITADIEVIDLDNDDIYEGESSNLDNINQASDLIYIIYTSGTTGKPKGVMLEHRNLVRLMFNSKMQFDFNQEDVWTMFHSFCFDFSVWEMYGALLYGGKLIVVPKILAQQPKEYLELLKKEKVTILNQTPTAFYNLINEELKDNEKRLNLRYVIFGGEALKPIKLREWRHIYPNTKLINMYGITETTVHVTYKEISEYEIEKNISNIGIPIPTLTAYVLDKNMKLLPIGVAGELCVGGAGVCRGYLNRPELTEQKFVDNPYKEGERLYKSGDLVRLLSNGDMEYLGRIDHQVKIRGHRIELGEIENKLLTHDSVKEAVVIAKGDSNDGMYLCSYIVIDNQQQMESELTINILREHLSKDLPDYMIPSYFIQLDYIPLTGNGKINRKSLPEPDGSMTTGIEYEAPRNEVEEKLVDIWRQVLGVEQIGINDSFFMLGGDSIKAIQVCSRLQKHNMKLEVKHLLQNLTIKEVSKHVSHNTKTIEQGIIAGEIQLTPIIKWFFEKDFTNKHHWNQGVMLYRKEGFNQELLSRVFDKILEHHDVLRTVCQLKDEEIVLINRDTKEKLYELSAFNLKNEENYIDIIVDQANQIQSSMELSSGPLVKLGLFNTNEGDHLLIAIHHLVIDGVSWRILFEDIATAYGRALISMPLLESKLSLQQKTDSFKRWSEEQNIYANSKKHLKELNFWKAIEETEIIPLPKDNIGGIGKLKDTAIVELELTEEQTNKLLKKSSKAYNTEINDLLLTALGMAIKQWTGNAKVLINLEGHGRNLELNDLDITRTVGWFTSMYPVILNLEHENIYNDEELKNHIIRTKETLRQVPNKGIGYGILKYLTARENKEGITFVDRAEISFNYMGQFDKDINTDIFQISNISIGNKMSLESETSFSLDINGVVLNNKLNIGVSYNKKEYQQSTMEELMQGYRANLIKVINHCVTKEEKELTPSDTSGKKIEVEEFEQIKKYLRNNEISLIEVEDIYPLSPMQQGMLFHILFESKGTNAYFEQTALEIDGGLNISIFEESLNKVVEKYDVLRTIFIYDKVNKPVQVVLKNRKANLYYEDISTLYQGINKLDYIEQFKSKDRERGFDLSNEIPIRVSILKMEEQKYVAIWSFHHIAMDGWCLSLIMEDFFKNYINQKEQREVKKEKAQPYATYIQWLEEQDKKEAINYWQEYLEEYEQKSTVPATNVIKDIESYKNGQRLITLNKEESKGLVEFAQKSEVTLNTVFQTVWGIILQRYNNTEDVVFGAVVSGRPAEIQGIEDIVGLFINTIPVRLTATGEKTLEQTVRELQKATIESKKYEYVSLAEIQSNSGLKQNPIDNIIVFENYPVGEEIEKNIKESKLGFGIKSIQSFEQTNYSFNLIILPGEELTIKIMYNEALYKEEQIEKVLGHINQVVNTIIHNPKVKLNEINIITEEEKQQLLLEFNNTDTHYPSEKTIHQLFQEQVEKTPNNIAVVYEDKHITYRELNERANQLARKLRAKGITADNIVGIMVERSLEMIVGIMAILKAGGAYLPIDPNYPEDRISFTLEDSNVSIILSQTDLRNKVTNSIEVIALDQEDIYQGESSNLENINKPNDLIYIIYTSGTTGKPKGVMLEHRNLVRLMFNNKIQFDFTQEDAWTMFHSFCFDFSVWEMYGALLYGGKLVVVPKIIAQQPKEYLELLKKEKITILNQIPTAFYSLINEELKCEEKNLLLRYVIFGGEALNPIKLREWRAIYPDTKLINMYGITETTVHVTYKEIRENEIEKNISNIGKPIPTLTTYILDKNMKLLPIGVAGELCVGGAGVARGYLNRPELTAEKFVYNPYKEGELLYKSGDLVRMLSNGDMEYLGRIDQQVKIRGHRIELGEIENKLLSHQTVKEAVVIAKADSNGEKYLCAYIVLQHIESKQEISVKEIRQHLSKDLPEYMIPSYFINIDNMPLTSNGKIDKKALADNSKYAQTEGIITGTEYKGPTNEVEQQLVQIWKEILSAENIGINNSFFELGGHSLKATSMVAKIHKQLNVEVPLKVIFKAPTIKEISEYIKSVESSIYSEIQPIQETEYYELSSAQKRIYTLQQFDHNSTSYNMPGLLEIEGELNKEKLESVFRTLIQRHESLRTSFKLVDEKIVQQVHKEVSFEIQYIDGKSFNKEEIQQILNNAIRTFELSKAPLLRVGLVELHAKKYILVFDMHHIISDGVSMSVLIEEFTKAYEGIELSKLRIQYKDYAVWQNQLLKSDKIKKQEQYWLNTYGEEVPVLNMPTDYQRPAIQSFEGNSIEAKIDRELTEKLKQMAKETGSTLYMVMLANLNILLSKYSGQEDIVIGSPISGRAHADLENIMGMFVNTLAMRNYPEGEKIVSEFLNEVKQNALMAYENQDYQFEELVEKLNIERDMSRNPIFDVMFTVQNMGISQIKLKDVIVKPYNTNSRISKFDITITAVEAGEQIKLTIEYCTNLFKRETIESLYKHYENITRQIVQQQDKKISEIQLITEEEKKQILVDFNNTEVAYPKDKKIHQLFEKQVQKTPHTIAVMYEGKHLTYRELNEKANQLARLIVDNIGESNNIVGIMVERSLEMIVGILAILKAGYAYLPIDPEYPQDRIEYMLKDCGVSVLLTQQQFKDKVGFCGKSILIDNKELYRGDTTNLSIYNSSELACVIYTSGSTGKPKGNLTTHYNIIRVVKETNYITITKEDTLLQLSNYAFDGSTFDIYGALLNGAKLVMVSKENMLDVNRLGSLIESEKITVFFVTTALFNTLVDMKIESLRNIRKVLFGGERVSLQHTQKALKKLGSGKIIHVYGPTESTVYATWYPVDTIDQASATVPIGRPISNTEIYILDNYNNLCPIGIAGELCIGGDGLAIGYLNRDELTKEKFIDNPIIPGRTMYRTGDLAKWLPDGNIEFLGRIDNQIKMRGYRIELGEIENKLLTHEQITEAVVIVKDSSGGMYLCAYIVSKEEIAVKEIRQHLSKDLPEYMIPSYFIHLDKMPLTANGKIDAKILPEPDGSIVIGTEYEAPRNEVEEKLVEIWEEVLGVDGIGINHNFFELGGHSLKATSMIAKLHKQLDIEVPLKEIFKTPTINGISEYISTIEKSMYSQIQPIQQIEYYEGIPYYETSSAQKRIYTLQQFDFNNTSYNMPAILEIEGALDKENLENAFRTLINRHEALRTSFKFVDEKLVQIVQKEINFEIEYISYNKATNDNLLSTEEPQQIKHIVSKFVRTFDLANAPLLRVALVEMTPEKYILMIDIHHIISDGVSMSILTKEFIKAYKGTVLPALRIQYKDYAVWQNQLLKSDKIKEQEQYWLNNFVGTSSPEEIPVLNIPTDYARPSIQSFEGNSIEISLHKELTEKLKKVAKQTGSGDGSSTLYMVMLGAFNILLSKYSGQEDIIVGSPIAGRPHGDLENIMGMFVNTLAMRNYPKGEKTVREFLKEVRETALKAYENQDYQFEELVEKLNIERDISRNPLFDVMFAMDNMEVEEMKLAGLKIKNCQRENNISKFDLTISAIEEKEKIVLSIEYCTKLFKQETIERISNHYINILEKICNNLDIKLEDIDLITEEEKQQILYSFNNTLSQYPKDKTIHQLFEEHASSTPHSIAVAYNNTELTYSELNKKSNQLARLLRDKGVEKDSIVAIITEKSIEMIIGIMGILKSGAAYLPIDPEYPKDRIEFMLKDSKTNILLTQSTLQDSLQHYKNTILLDKNDTYSGDDHNLAINNTSKNLAYLMYTSGTTGKPKGVMIEHKSVVNLCTWMNNRYNLKENKNIIQLTSICFDVSVEEIMGALVNGGTIYIPNSEIILDKNKFYEFVNKHHINMAQFVPVTLRELVLENKYMESLNIVICGSDRLEEPLKNKILDMGYELYNCYGPTEITVDAVTTKCQRGKETIGKPIANATAYILDQHNKLCPIGVPGELCIGGEGLARGYFNRPELTAEKFVDNHNEVNKRIYRTGDLVRWLSDGNIEFLGRIDHQVKIRGYRIELGEIENRLMTYEGVKEAVVIAKTGTKDSSDDKYLCAYIVTQDIESKEEVAVKEIRQHLSKDLPDYMIPSYFIQLDKMPVTPNGKIDRKALADNSKYPEPDGNIMTGTEYEAPRNEVEEKLSEIWKEVLGVDGIGINHNFFELGGHSLKATNVIAKIHKHLNVEIPLKEIFKEPTIKGISEYINTIEKSIYSEIQPVEISYNEGVSVFDATSAQKRIYTLQQFDLKNTSYNMPVILEIEGELDKERLGNAFKTLIQRHESLRTSFSLEEEKLVQIVHKETDFEIEYITCNQANVIKEIQSIAGKFIRAFDLSKAPLLRICLVEVASEKHIIMPKHILMLDMHHIISDGVSMSILTEEFAKVYEGIELPKLRVQYKDYAVWQNQLLKSDKIKKQEQYWLNSFVGTSSQEEIPVLNMPTDYIRPSIQSFEGDSIDFCINGELTERLRQIAKETGSGDGSSTLYMVMLSIFNILLSKYSGQEDIIIGSPIAGRPHADLDNIIGMFVNTLAMRNYPKGEKTVREFLIEVQETSLRAYENQDYQFEELVDKLNIKRDMSRNPLFDVMFVMQNTNTRDIKLKDIAVREYNSNRRISKFDITLNAVESAEEIILSIEYCTKLFNRKTIEKLYKHYENISQQIVQGLDKKLRDIELITQDEKQQVLLDFNNTEVDYPKDKTINQLFEEQVEKTPNNIAVVYGDKQLSYRELNQKSNQLARILRAKGVGVDGNIGSINHIGIMVERSLEMIIGIMAILKAGGAYLPIDPKYPQDRIDYMLEDSGAEILLTQSMLVDNIKNTIEIIALDDENIYCGENHNLNSVSSTSDLAYVIYTSGSTGKPKGVMIEHHSLNNFIYSFNRIYDNKISQEDSCLSTTNISFDVSVGEIFLPLYFGAKLVLYKENKILDINTLANSILEHQISFTYIPPTILQELYNELTIRKEKLKLNKILVGVEPIKDYVLEQYLSLNKEMKIINGYGPTETTIFSSTYKYISQNTMGKNIPIGTPISNTKIYILDNSNKLCPIGVSGELCIAGDGLARGYLNRPQLTNEKFVANPFDIGQKMYRTGDLARWQSDGNIEFLGRIDNQVKIRGYRIELGEIESRLLSLEEIIESVVVAKQDNNNIKYLCAYIVSEKQIVVKEIRQYLSRNLPDYMIPSYFIQLDKLPTTSNGKIDKKLLPEPDGNMITTIDYEAPRNQVEEKLVELWKEILGVNNIGINDNFFELGGHSLKAASLLARLHKEYNKELSLKEIFTTPTIKGIAEYLRTTIESKYEEIEKIEESQYYEMSHSQKRLLLINQIEPNSIAYNMPSEIDINEELDPEYFNQAIKELLNRHESLRTSFLNIHGNPVQLINEVHQLPIKNYDISNLLEEEKEKQLKEICDTESKYIFKLQDPTLFRASVIKIGSEKYKVLIVMHHIITDGWSMYLLANDFKVIYSSIKNRQEVNLKPLKIQYKDYANWQNKIINNTSRMEKVKEFWIQQLQGEIQELQLPKNETNGNLNKSSAIQFVINQEITDKIRKLSLKYNTSIYTVLITSLKIYLSGLTGQKDILIGSAGSGRQHEDLNNIVGYFINTLIIRNTIDYSESFEQLLSRVNNNVLQVLDYQYYPIELILDELNIKYPSINVFFNMINIVENKEELVDFNTKYENEVQDTKFDLAFYVVEHKNGIVLNVNYRSNKFETDIMESMIKKYVNTIEYYMDNPINTVNEHNKQKRRVKRN